MRKAFIILAVLAVLSAGAVAETFYVSISATDVSATTTFTTPRASVMVCNLGANEAYFRLFHENDTPAAATNAYNYIAPGSVAAPVCISFVKGQTAGSYYKYLSVICSAGETATVTVYSE